MFHNLSGSAGSSQRTLSKQASDWLHPSMKNAHRREGHQASCQKNKYPENKSPPKKQTPHTEKPKLQAGCGVDPPEKARMSQKKQDVCTASENISLKNLFAPVYKAYKNLTHGMYTEHLASFTSSMDVRNAKLGRRLQQSGRSS